MPAFVFKPSLSRTKLRDLLFCVALVSMSALAQEPGVFLHESDVSWKVNEHQVARWKTLVGGSEGGQIDRDDIQFGTWQLAPGAVYHRHRHEVPEIYFITGGRALWTVGDESREVGPGMTIYTRPGAEHRMENLGSEPVSAIWVWWAPGGDRDVFSGDYEFTEPAPAQSPGFTTGETERLY
jgi:mannose-6-phosphate isomerase-like protein (cupin superfamily)